MDQTKPQNNPRMMIAALLISFLWVGVLYLIGPRGINPGTFGERNIRYPARFDWMLHDLEDRPIRFDKFQGKTIFLNVWATWCPPCVAEMPSIARLAENPRLRGKNIELICVSVDDSTDKVRQFLKGKNWKMTFLRADALPPAYQSEGIPATFAISPEGVVVGAVEGSSDWDNPEVISFLESIAVKPPGKPRKQ
jgi:thiol-disulfide isomerase/thioredoxin